MCASAVIFEFVLCVKWQQLTLDIFMLNPRAATGGSHAL